MPESNRCYVVARKPRDTAIVDGRVYLTSKVAMEMKKVYNRKLDATIGEFPYKVYSVRIQFLGEVEEVE